MYINRKKTEHRCAQTIPRLDRTLTDAYMDELYAPGPALQTPTQAASNHSLLPNNNNVLTDRLQAAQMARSLSPTQNPSRALPHVPTYSQLKPNAHTLEPRLSATVSTPQNPSQQAAASPLPRNQTYSRHDDEVRAISPKDALLDHDEAEQDSRAPNLNNYKLPEALLRQYPSLRNEYG
jgi:hypothetical protein